jgi:hypothetical protein
MKAASAAELKKELMQLKTAALTELCLRLAKFKKENKELLTYLLFEAHDEENYIKLVIQEIDDQFSEINYAHLYYIKKSLRKILRVIAKHVRYTTSKQAEVTWLLHFCSCVKEAPIPHRKYNMVISNIYNSQLKKIESLINTFHEDLQYEFSKQLKPLAE